MEELEKERERRKEVVQEKVKDFLQVSRRLNDELEEGFRGMSKAAMEIRETLAATNEMLAAYRDYAKTQGKLILEEEQLSAELDSERERYRSLLEDYDRLREMVLQMQQLLTEQGTGYYFDLE